MKITVEMIQDLKNEVRELQPKNIKVVNGKGVFSINEIKKYIESVSRLSNSFEFSGSKKILSRYANKKINPKFYGKIDVMNIPKTSKKKGISKW